MNHSIGVEGAFLNSAFGAQAIHVFIEAYERQRRPVPLELIFPAVAIAFNGDIRDELSGNQTSNLVSVIGSNPQLKVGLSDASRALNSFAWRSLGVLVAAGRVELKRDGTLTSSQPVQSVPDSDKCISAMKLMGTLCGKIGDPTTVFALLEVQP